MPDNFHLKEPTIQITDDSLCKQVQNGGSIAKDVKELKARSLEYYNENMDHQFPPSYYLAEDSTSKWADKISDAIPDVKIIVGYNPVDHLELLGLEKDELQQILGDTTTLLFNNSVIAVDIKRRWVMVSVVTNETDNTAIGIELKKLDGILKTIYHSNVHSIKNEYIGVAGILVMPNISSCSDLKTNEFISWGPDVNQLFISKTEWDSNLDGLKQFTQRIIDEIKNNCQGIITFYFNYIRKNIKLSC